jgi:probable H4MPT-linked C1 transfer pathway protein
MTAELCDCFPTKRDGVVHVVDAVASALPGRPTWVWGLDGRFWTAEQLRRNPLQAAAANWLALANVAARLAGPRTGLLIDIGSTTTDLIPSRNGAVVARGRTDTERLGTGELVYAGVRRTPVCAIANRLRFRGRETGLAAELFATTLDVYLTRGAICEDPDDNATGDGRPATIDAARDRLARMVGADREGFSREDAIQLSRSVHEALIARLAEAATLACTSTVGPPRVVVVAGSGEFLARELAHRLSSPPAFVVSLAERWGVGASSAGCAHALLTLARSWAARGGLIDDRDQGGR